MPAARYLVGGSRVSKSLLTAVVLALLPAQISAQVETAGNYLSIALGEFESTAFETQPGAEVRLNFFNYYEGWPAKWRVRVVNAANPAQELFSADGYAEPGTGETIQGQVSGVKRIIGLIEVSFDGPPEPDPAGLQHQPVMLASLEIFDQEGRTAIWGSTGTAVVPFQYPPSTLTDEGPAVAGARPAAPGKAILYPPITKTGAELVRLKASNALGTTSAKVRLLMADGSDGGIVKDSCAVCSKFGNLPPYNELLQGGKQSILLDDLTEEGVVVPIVLLFDEDPGGASAQRPPLLSTVELQGIVDGRHDAWAGLRGLQ